MYILKLSEKMYNLENALENGISTYACLIILITLVCSYYFMWGNKKRVGCFFGQHSFKINIFVQESENMNY